MIATIVLCDVCRKIPGHSLPHDIEVTRYSCGHDVCAGHTLEKTDRGEPICARCHQAVYVKEIIGQ